MLMIFNVPKEVVGNLNVENGAANVSEETLIEVVKHIVNGVIIQDGATNGDIIKVLFPTCKDWKCTYAGEEIHLVQLPDSLRINEYLESWWNAPYRKETIMQPLTCCLNCKEYDSEHNTFRNKLRCMITCDAYAEESVRIAYEELKADKGCSTCKHCRHVRNYPGFVTGEECECNAGLECDTVLFRVKNCLKWVGRYEGEDKENNDG